MNWQLSRWGLAKFNFAWKFVTAMAQGTATVKFVVVAEKLFVALSVTMYDRQFVYTWLGLQSILVLPSPKSQKQPTKSPPA